MDARSRSTGRTPHDPSKLLRPTALALALAFALPAVVTPQTAAADAPTPRDIGPQDITSHQIPQLTLPVGEAGGAIDGRLDEAHWADAARIELAYENSPGDNSPAGVRTTLRMFHTEDALYLGFRAEDPDPARIRAFLRDRDALYEDDFLGVQLDTFDDRRRAYEFFVNPLGVQADGIIDETRGGDNSWDGLWSSAGRITDFGYETEIRIPFATLRFADGGGPKRWGLRAMRVRPREYSYVYFSAPRPRGAPCDLCTMGTAQGFAGVRPGRNLEIVPTLTLRNAETRAPGGGWRSGEGLEVEPGLDLAWAPTPNLTLNGTLNPDFSQVESDRAQLDLNSNFALFFPEKRPFFLEGADYFNTPLNIVYTRQIADPDVGVRVTGRSGAQAYGLVVARDATTQLLVPGVLGSSFRFLEQEADALIGRYRYNVSGGLSLGAVLTHRSGEDYRNTVAGGDLRWQHGNHTITSQWLRSDSRYPGGLRSGPGALGDSDPAGNAFWLYYTYAARHWNAYASRAHIAPGFTADLGFIGQVGYRKSVFGSGRTWYGAEGAAINKVVLSAEWDITHRDDGQLLERELEGSVSFYGPQQSTLSVGGLGRTRFWDNRLFDERWGYLIVSTVPLAGVKLGLNLRAGDQLDLQASRVGQVREWQSTAVLDLGRGVNFNLSYLAQRLDRDGGTAFEVDVLDGRLSWQFDPRQRLRLSVQATEVARDPRRYAAAATARSRDIATQLLYSYRVNPRTGLYLGYSHGGYSDDVQRTLADRSRSLFLKLTYAWQP